MTPFLENIDTGFKGISDRIITSLKESGVISDSNVGSVIRTLVESFAREMATFYAMLEIAHTSGYLETAEGQALDNVVAILGIERAKAGRLTGRVIFSRISPAPSDIVIPAGLSVTGPDLPDGTPVPVVETVEEVVISRGEMRVTVAVQEIPGSDKIECSTLPPGTLTIMPRPVLGVEAVTNTDIIKRGGRDEKDSDLRNRARVALREGQRSTVEAIEAAVREQGLQQVNLEEPADGPPGRLNVLIGDTGFEQNSTRQQSVKKAILSTKAAGIRVNLQYLQTVYFVPVIIIEPEDPDLDESGFRRLAAELKQGVAKFLNGLPAGTSVSLRKFEATLLGHTGVRDVEVERMDTFFLQYPDDAKSSPEPIKDTGERELPGGDWYIGPLEIAAVITDTSDLEGVGLEEINLDEWSTGIQRRRTLTARIDLTVAISENDLPLATIKELIRATVDNYVARIQPTEKKQERIISHSDLKNELASKAFLKNIITVETTHQPAGLVESLKPDNNVTLQKGERLKVGRIDIVVEEQ